MTDTTITVHLDPACSVNTLIDIANWHADKARQAHDNGNARDEKRHRDIEDTLVGRAAILRRYPA